MSSTTICQILSCTNAQFTYCPHCSLYICIKCLNEHYVLMENNYAQNLLNFKKELINNHYHKIVEQKETLEKIYDYEVAQYYECEKYLSDKIDQTGIPILTNFQPYQYLDLKQNFSLFIENRQKFDQLLNQINQLIFNFQETNHLSRNSSVISTLSEVNTEDIHSESISVDTIKLEDHTNESNTKPNTIGTLKSFVEERLSHVTTTSNLPIQSNYYDQNGNSSMKLDPQCTYTTKELRRLYFYCPFTKYTLGLQDHHCQSMGLVHIPCRRVRRRKYLLYTHLHRYHLFDSQLSLKILRALVYLPDDIDKIDLFSKQLPDELGKNTLESYSDYCPLTKLGVYGILSEHQVKLCNENNRNKFILLYHFRKHHHLSDQHSARLVDAIMDNIDKNIPIIKPSEIILV